jgi:hypothetical protein
MQPLSNFDLLTLWERGARMHPLDRSVLAVAAALPEAPVEAPADWPLGRRNRMLAELHCACFGSRLQGWLPCAQCGERLEFEMDGRALASEQGGHAATEPVVVNGQSFRLPTSRDLARLAGEADSRSAAMRLLQYCRLEFDGAPALEEEDLEQIEEQLALADPLAETRLAMHCPACDHQWDETLNIGEFLWAEIEARARRLLFETHMLASAYGWSENEILSLSDPRRQLYLEMVQR